MKGFKSLEGRLKDLPLILAGPIVRRTEPEQVTVWVALKAPRKVTLHIYKKIGDEPLFSGTTDTISLGDKLHITAVTAKTEAALPLQWGTPYYYDLHFELPDVIGDPPVPDDLLIGDLNTQNIVSPFPESGILTYNGDLLPSFVLPAATLEELRIIHSSCRKPHGEGEDMLAKVDELLEKSPTLKQRPQQLFLNGDQIYADDVAPTMLEMLRDASDALLEWKEMLPGGISSDDQQLEHRFGFKLTDQSFDRMKADGRPSNLIEVLRKIKNIEKKEKGSFLSLVQDTLLQHRDILGDDTEKYLLPEYLSSLWTYTTPPRILLSIDEAKFTAGDVAANHLFTAGEYWMMYLFVWSDVLWDQNIWTNEEFDNETDQRIYNLYKKLPNVRKALANISTYMICDDHEITDDWFLNLQWCVDVFSSQLGRRILLNGMLGYALFQAWGNNPEQFENEKRGQEFLKAVQEWKPQEDALPEHQKTIQKKLELTLGIADADMVKEIKRARSLHVLHTESQKMALNWHYHVPGSKHQVIVLDTRTWRRFPGDPLKSPEIENPDANLNDGYNAPNLLGEVALQGQIKEIIKEKTQKDITFVVSAAPVIGIPWVLNGRFFLTKEFGDYEDWERQEEAVWNFLARLSILGTPIAGEHKTRVIFLSGDIHFGYTSKMTYQREPLPEPPELKKGSNSIFVQLNSSAFKNEDLITREVGKKGYELFLSGAPEVLSKKSRDKVSAYKIQHIVAEPFAEPDPIECISMMPKNLDATEDMTYLQCLAKKSRRNDDYGTEIVGKNNLGEVYFRSIENLVHILYWKDEEKPGESPYKYSEYNVDLRFVLA